MKVLLFAATILSTAVLGSHAHAQDGTQTEIVFTVDKKAQAREQVRRLLAAYDLDPWIFTDEVRIGAGVDPHSMPILTLNTDYLEHDEMQLSIFLHEQAHWFVYEHEARDVAIEELRELYPDAPASDHRIYQHLLVAWVELDAMAELVGEARAREVLKEKVERIVGGDVSEVDERYSWYNYRVLEETDRIADVASKHGLVITPAEGLAVDAR